MKIPRKSYVRFLHSGIQVYSDPVGDWCVQTPTPFHTSGEVEGAMVTGADVAGAATVAGAEGALEISTVQVSKTVRSVSVRIKGPMGHVRTEEYQNPYDCGGGVPFAVPDEHKPGETQHGAVENADRLRDAVRFASVPCLRGKNGYQEVCLRASSKDKTLTVCGTDSVFLHLTRMPWEGSDFEAIVDVRALLDVLKLVPATRFSHSGKTLLLTQENGAQGLIPLSDKIYTAYEKILPKTQTHSAEFDAGELATALGSVVSAGCLIRFQESGTITISFADKEGLHGIARCKGIGASGEITACFTPSVLLASLRAFTGRVRLEYSNGSYPCTIRQEGSRDLSVVMPLSHIADYHADCRNALESAVAQAAPVAAPAAPAAPAAKTRRAVPPTEPSKREQELEREVAFLKDKLERVQNDLNQARAQLQSVLARDMCERETVAAPASPAIAPSPVKTWNGWAWQWTDESGHVHCSSER